MTTGQSTPRRYGGKTPEQRRAERRERLLDAGLELFGTQGFAATTIEALCAAARCNARYFYEEFATREALLGAVYERHATTVATAVTAALELAPPEPLTRFGVGVRAFLDGTLDDPRAARINYFEVVGVSPELERRRRDVLRAYADLIAVQMQQLEIDVRDPHGAAVALVGAVDGLVIDWLSGDRGSDREPIVATLVELFGGLMRRA